MKPDAHRTPRPRRYPIRAIFVAAFIAGAGPPVGYLFFGIPVLAVLIFDLVTGAENLKSERPVNEELRIFLMFIVTSYVLGGVQALITGFLLGLRTYFQGSVTLRETVAAALAGSLAFTLSIMASYETWDFLFFRLEKDLTSGLVLAMISVSAAVVSCLLLHAIGVLPSKPPGSASAP